MAGRDHGLGLSTPRSWNSLPSPGFAGEGRTATPPLAAALRWSVGVAMIGSSPAPADPPQFPATRAAMMAARTDVWAEAAIRQPGGPSYEFFRDLLPPLRYVNTAFRHYPIVL